MLFPYRCRCKIMINAVTAVIVAIAVTSCVDDPVIDCCDRPPAGHAIIAVITAAPDFSASNFEMISTDDHSVRSNLFSGLHNDHAVRAFVGGGVYILERYGADRIIKYNARDMAVEYQRNLGIGQNIQDIAEVSETKAYISALESGDLIIFDPQAGIKTSAVDLSRFNAYIGTENEVPYPYVGALAVNGGYLYAACQRLNAFFGLGDTSLIAYIDIETDSVAGSVKLYKRNPASLAVFGNSMLVSSQGDWMDVGGADAGVEMIDLTTNANLGVVADGSSLGGNPSNVVFVSDNKAYICVMDASYATFVVSFDPSTGAVGERINGIGDASGGLAFDGEKVYVGDRGLGNAGVAVVNIETNTVEQKITTGMPPSSLAIIFADRR